MYKPKEGESFICINDSFEEVKIIRAYLEKEDNNKLYATFYKSAKQPQKATKEKKASKGEPPEFLKMPIEDFKGELYPSFIFGRLRKELEDEYDIYIMIRSSLDSFLYHKPSFEAGLDEIEQHLILETRQDKEKIRIILKVLVAELLQFTYKTNKSGQFVGYSELKSKSTKREIYYGSLANEIKVKSDQVSLLICHGQSVGNYREYILREMLKKYVPSKFTVATGFIEGIDSQIDILIYDSQNHSASFMDGDLVVVKQEAVRAVIEVKTNLTSAKLKEGLDFFYDLTRPGIFKPDLPIFKGIFSFDTTYKDSKSIAKYIKDYYNKPYFEEKIQEELTRDILCLFREVTCVAVLNQFCVFSNYMPSNETGDGNVIPFLLSIDNKRKLDVQTATFISLLFDYLDVDYNAKQSTISSFQRIYNSSDVNFKIECKLTDDDWIPASASQNEHDFTAQGVKERIKKINDWLNGEVTTTEYLKEIRGTNDPKT